MGFRFRKSFKLGPFRFTASKSGISSSFGLKGFRVTKRADGKTQTTVSIPGTGISHVSVSNGAKTETQTPVKTAEAIAEETASPYEFVRFYLRGTQEINADGQKRQDVLYLYKMRRPPYDIAPKAELISDDAAPDVMQIAINGSVVGDVPKKYAEQLSETWDRIDGVTAIDVEGRRGTYDAYAYVRLKKSAD